VNYNVVYPVDTRPIANQPATAYTSNWNVNYNVAYPVANRPIANQPPTAWTINYNVVPVEANRPVTAYTSNWNVNYNVAYPEGTRPEATRPATAWTINYNVAYPVANRPEATRPATSYSPGTIGTPTNVLGVYFPGGAVETVAPYVGPTEVRYWDYPDFTTHPVAVPPGGQIIVKIE
jgi:hypothetical protein